MGFGDLDSACVELLILENVRLPRADQVYLCVVILSGGEFSIHLKFKNPNRRANTNGI